MMMPSLIMACLPLRQYCIHLQMDDNEQSLIPLYVHKVVPKLTGQFRKSQGFRPVQIISQIVALQVAFWFTIAAFQFILISIPSGVLRLSSQPFSRRILFPSFDLLFDLSNLSLKSIYPILNCIAFLISGYMR